MSFDFFKEIFSDYFNGILFGNNSPKINVKYDKNIAIIINIIFNNKFSFIFGRLILFINIFENFSAATADAKNKDNVISICIIARKFEENFVFFLKLLHIYYFDL